MANQLHQHRLLVAVITTALLVASLFCTTAAFADEPASASSSEIQTVKVGYYESRSFQEGAAEGQPKSGYGYEYLEKVASYAGFSCEYVYGSWSDLYDALARGDIDMLAGVARSDQHSSQVLFPSVGMLNETFYLYKHAQDSSIQAGDTSSFSGKRIGVMSGSSSRASLALWLASSNCTADVIDYPSFSSCYQAFSQGDLDAFVGADNIAHGLDDAQTVEIIGREPYYLAVSQQRPDVLLKVNEALTVMNAQDKAFLSDLQSRYTADSSVNAFLSAEELAWTQEHPVFTIGYLNRYLPFCDTLPDGSPTGFMVDVVAAMLDGLPGSWEPEVRYVAYDDQADLIAALKAGQVDVAFPVGGSTWCAEQDGYVRSSAVVSPSMELVMTGVYDFDAETINSIAVNRNNLMQRDYAVLHFPNAQLVECSSIEECLAAVRSGRAEATLVNGLRAASLLASEPGLTSVSLPVLDERSFGIAAGNTALVRLTNRGIGILGENFCMNASYRYTEGLMKYTIADFVRDNWVEIAVLLVVLIVIAVFASVRHYRRLRRETQREVEQNRKLEEALAAAERANQAKDVLLGNLSHDIRTPLNGILGVMEVNSSCADPQQVRQNMAKAQLAARQLTGLVDDLLEMSKLKSGDLEVSVEPFALGKLLDDTLAPARVQAQDAGVDLALEGADKLAGIRVLGNPTFVHQAFANVLDNAIRYNKRGGAVAWRVDLSRLGDTRVQLSCEIADTGIGMSAEYLAHMFEPFSQEASTARSVYPGSGLGMPIVKALVELMGGTIGVESVQGEGTTVRITLPFEQASADMPDSAAENAPRSIAGMHFLLVEDNDLNLDITRCVLEREGACVSVARDGQQAVDAFGQAPPGTFDAVLMDIMMPVMDGYAATRAIRALERPDAASVPIIAMTANVFADDRARALDAGMNEHLSKPLDVKRLVATLARYRQ